MKKRTYILTVMLALSLTTTLIAHPGRTDGRGGHNDNKNKSGLGKYHYHCGDYPAHLHNKGKCPYVGNGSGGYNPTTSSNFSNSATTPKQAKLQKQIDVIVNGDKLADCYAIQVDGRTIVALRPICDALGVSLHWDSETQTAIGQKANTTFQLTIGSEIAKINNETITLDVTGQVIGGKTLVPVRFIGESLGAVVDFDSSINSVVITTNN